MGKQNDLAYGRRAVIEQKRLLTRHLEDIIKYNTKTDATSYTPDDIFQLCIDVAMGVESYKSAGIKHGVSYNTINEWKRKGWIYEAVEVAREIAQDKLDRRFTGVINKALDNLDNALDKGDAKVGKDGKLKYQPVTAKDNALIAAIAFDKRQLIRGESTSINENKDGDDKLAQLAEQFKKFAMREEKTIEGEAERVQDEQGSEGSS